MKKQLYLVISLALVSLAQLTAESLDTPRQLIKASIEVQQTLQREKEDWNNDRQILERQIQQYQEQKKELELRLVALKEKKQQLEREQLELKNWESTQQQWLDNIEKEVSLFASDPLYQIKSMPGSMLKQLEHSPEQLNPTNLVGALQSLIKKQVAWASQHGECSIIEQEVIWEGQSLTKPVLHLGAVLQYCDFAGQLLWRTSSTAWKNCGPTPATWSTLIESVAGRRAPELFNLPIPKEVL